MRHLRKTRRLSFHLVCSLSATAYSGAQTVTNPSFESWGDPTTCEINTAPDSWDEFSDGGLGADEGKFSICPHSIPAGAHEGEVYARFYGAMNAGEGIVQAVSGLTPGATYVVSYWYAGSNLYGGTSDGYFQAYVDGLVVDVGPTFSSTKTDWTEHVFSFLASASTHQIGFRARSTTTLTSSLGMDLLSIAGDCTTSTYCNPASGSTDNLATLDISGCDLTGNAVITMSNGPAGQFAYALIGNGSTVVTNPPGALGDLCVTGGSCLGRYSKDIATIDNAGTYTIDVSNSISGGGNYGIPTCGSTIQSGETWNFQVWHRNPMGAPAGFSEALSVTFQ